MTRIQLVLGHPISVVLLRAAKQMHCPQNSCPPIPHPFLKIAVVLELGCITWENMYRMTSVADRKEVEQRRTVMVCGLQAGVLLMTFSLEVLTLSAVSFWL